MNVNEDSNFKVSVGVVADAAEETFCLVCTDGGLIKKMFFGTEHEMRGMLNKTLKNPLEADSVLAKARQNPV